MSDAPARIARLERDKRDYPIPWNVLRADGGEPFFTVNDDRKAFRALREQRCPLCGEKLGAWKYHVGGIRSAFHEHGWYFDLPGHRECITFALQTCPYLALPKYLGRIDVVNPKKLPTKVLLDETQIPDRPEVFVMVAGSGVELQTRGALIPYTRPKRPFRAVEYWRHGRQLSEAEALPYLRAAMGAEWTPPEVAA